MADIQARVLFEFQLGLPWRQATKAQRDKATETYKAMIDKWKAAGIEELASLTTQATEYPHHFIYKLKSADQLRQMAVDINEANDCFKFVAKFNLVLGWEGF
jgi:hypothetical protein